MASKYFARAIKSLGMGAAASTELLAMLSILLAPSRRYYVCSATGSSANAGTTQDAPKATIAQALALCAASRGDIIVVLPGHAETIGASGLAWNVAGVTILGIGNGTNRPTLTFSTTDAKVTISANNVTVQNIRCVVSIDDVVQLFSVTGTNVTLDTVDFSETTSMQALNFLTTTAAGDYLTIRNCLHIQITAGSAKWIDLVGADQCVITDNKFHVNATTHVIGGTTTASLQIFIANNQIVNPANAASIVLLTGSTGSVSNNTAGSAKTSIAGTFALASAYGFNNLGAHTANKSGLLDPVVDT